MRGLCCWMLVALSASVAETQHRPLDFTFVGPGSFLGPIGLGRYTVGGGVTTLVPASRFGKASLWRGAVDVDNRGHVLTMIDGAGNFGVGLLVVDGLGRVTTIRITGPDVQVQDVRVDQDGDYLVLVSPGILTTFPSAIVRVDRNTHASSIAVSGVFTPRPLAMTIDRDTGDFVVLDTGHSQGNKILRIARDGSTVVTMATVAAQTWPSPSDLEQHPANGSFYFTRLAGLHRLTPGSALRTIGTGVMGGRTGSLLPDRSSAPAPRLVGVFGSNVTPQSLYRFDIGTETVTTIVAQPPWPAAGKPRHFLWHHGREVATLRTGPRMWRVYVDFPGQGGRGFVVALSAKGTRPGLPLAGRRARLDPDVLTALSAKEQLRPFLTGNVGTLSPSGSAAAKLDLTGLPGLAGVRLWLLAVALDPRAPGGVATISDPILLVP